MKIVTVAYPGSHITQITYLREVYVGREDCKESLYSVSDSVKQFQL